MSPFFSDPAGPTGFAGGPVGLYGTLSPSDSDPAGPVGPYAAGALLAQIGRCPRFSLTLLARLALQVALSARVGRCPRLNMILLAQMACMFQVALWACLAHCPRLNPVLRYWWTLGGGVPMSDPPPGGTLPPGAGGLPSCPDGVGTPAVVMVCGNAYSIENNPFSEEYGHTEMIAIDGFRGEIVDGMVVYYEDNLCDSDESDWENPYDVAGRQYVDDYNFDAPDGMDLMVFERGEKPSGSEMMDMERTDLTLVCQTTLSVPEGKLDTGNIYLLANVASAKFSECVAVVSPTIRGGDRHDTDSSGIDEGYIEDDERSTWMDWCGSAFYAACGTFPSAADDPQPTVVFRDELFLDEVLTDSAVSVHEELSIVELRIPSCVGVTVIPPVIDRPVQRIMDGLVGKDNRMDEVSISWPICHLPIHIGDIEVSLSHGDTKRICLLHPADVGGVNSGTVELTLDGRRLDHWHSVVWDPGIVGSQALLVCYDCLCLMALFRAVMSSVHDWAEWSVWTWTGSGYYRTITWDGGYLPRLCPPCDGDRLCDYMAWLIKGPVMIVMLDWDENNSLSAGRIPRIVIGRLDCGGGPVDCSDWTRVRDAVDSSPGEVRIDYIRGLLWDRSSTDAAPVTGSLVFSELFVCLDVYCAAGFASCRIFCSTDCVLLAGFGLSFRRVSEYWDYGNGWCGVGGK